MLNFSDELTGGDYVFIFRVIRYSESKLKDFRMFIERQAPEVVYEKVEFDSKNAKLYFYFTYKRPKTLVLPKVRGYGLFLQSIFEKAGIYVEFIEAEKKSLFEKVGESIQQKIVNIVGGATETAGQVVGRTVKGLLDPIKQYLIYIVLIVVAIVIILYFIQRGK